MMEGCGCESVKNSPRSRGPVQPRCPVATTLSAPLKAPSTVHVCACRIDIFHAMADAHVHVGEDVVERSRANKATRPELVEHLVSLHVMMAVLFTIIDGMLLVSMPPHTLGA